MFQHIPVLCKEVLSYLNPQPGEIFADGTLGGAGHAFAICQKIGKAGHYFAVDQDQVALDAAAKRLASVEAKVTLVHANYAELADLLQARFPDGVHGILLDIGVSSPQIDTAARGFSYMQDAPLDMRMNQAAELTAAIIVNTWSEEAIRRILWEYGEEKWAARIAALIVEHRQIQPIERTLALVDVIERAIPKKAREKGSHVGKRTFQALRIATNDELQVLDRSLDALVDCLKPGGRIAVITFHSLEDRIVKNHFKYLATHCICPPKQPICTCGKQASIRIITRKPIVAEQEELVSNSRAASAKLRVAEKIS